MSYSLSYFLSNVATVFLRFRCRLCKFFAISVRPTLVYFGMILMVSSWIVFDF
ncbi:hypothetical protein E9M_06635 [Moraxella catarrhalis 46P47B1]|uniref:Uncharacterized protein n=1 Tax=Moraxella catarrhalis TaxID=480 RepID=A0A3S9QDL1_MORCA|nr:hypothetical protein MCR_1826 [Moraxella catarrhalis BBH18]AZQ86439.1 hypothetical protein EJK52_1876 [Moraxella catarrhalis]EGE11622.1 hypothetical protein E9M_06635 [Moraxella catarrhalis 46P47B1]EGE15341.1 hypothetical protein E9K_03516 [Moraxella catarrhalis 103P14B1]EGE16262.1 hypothetical protein E9Q_08925 [Moraxella catarrhalis BC1]EGE17912.1 hypothetical protein E9O_00210 [Moraxella catarrhalis 12P80B1]EGE18273.1 hypothetical protein E9U_09145 [Moraxella catarrhalis BC8]EGE22169.1